jgi:organic radical activating enzyme
MKLKVSEIFYSAQGEGRFVGVPSVFLRTFGCNFTCSGFGMPSGQCSTERDQVKVELYKTYEALPLVTTGCDSYASWDARFKHLSPSMTTDKVIDRMLELTPNHSWQQDTGNDVHLVITGGEPLLGWQRVYPELLEDLRMRDLRNITFETNGTQKLSSDFQDYVKQWRGPDWLGRDITFSVSAKLSTSGEKWSDAIKPQIVAEYAEFGTTYLKFVVENATDFDEVDQAVAEYRAAGFHGVVYVMPVGGVIEVYHANMTAVADECMKRGYYFSPRLHTSLWGNAWGK